MINENQTAYEIIIRDSEGTETSAIFVFDTSANEERIYAAFRELSGIQFEYEIVDYSRTQYQYVFAPAQPAVYQ